MTALQRRALVSLVVGRVWTAVRVVLFVSRGGVEAFASDDSTRVLLSVLFVLMLLFTAFFGVPWKARKGPGGDVDERDLSVLQRATQVQFPGYYFAYDQMDKSYDKWQTPATPCMTCTTAPCARQRCRWRCWRAPMAASAASAMGPRWPGR